MSRIFYYFVIIFLDGCWHQREVNGENLQAAGPRFLSEMPTEVAFTPDRGWTLDCPIQGRPAPQITWLSSKGNGALWSPVAELPNLIILPTSTQNGSLILLPFRPEHFRPDVHSTVYKCSASNIYGKILSTPIQLRAVMLPPFEATVDNPRARRGGTAVFRCTVPDSVKDHVTITSWIQDNRYDIFLTSSQDGRHVMLPNGELHILSVRQGDESHLYNCRLLLKPNGQTMTSSTAGHIILHPDSTTRSQPVILDSAARIQAWRGQDVVLPCLYQGYPHPRVKWYRSQTIKHGNLMIPIIPSQHHQGLIGRHKLIGGTLVISSIVPEDQGRYICTVNNTFGSSESRTELLFREKLSARILESPSGMLTVDADTEVSLTCSFSGSPRPTVSWFKDGQRYIGKISEGSNQLHINSVTKEDQGMYQCFLTNEEGDSAQSTVQLIIGAFPPHLKQTFSRQILHPGSSVSFKCLASGTPPPHFTWTLDGYPLPVSERYFLGQQQTGIEDQVVTHLNISHVRVEDGGNYKCTAENRVGKVEHSATLHIYGAPYVRPMSNVAAVGGKKLELSCPVAGYPIESIIWEKDGRRLPLNGRQRVQQFNGSLIIDPVDKSSDAGQYTCEARGQDVNNLARQSLQLSIIDAPHMMAMSESAVVNAGERLALQCAVIKGGLPLSIIWLKEDSVLPPPPSSGISVKLINDFTATLTVESLTGHHAGRYTCTATNPAGRAQSSVLVIVQASPRIAPFSTSRSVMVNSRLQMSCVIEEGDPPFTIRWLRNHRLITSTSSPIVRVTDFNSYSSILTIDQVTLSHAANYSCRAENAAGSALQAAQLQVSVPPMWMTNQPPVEAVQTVRGHSVELPCAVGGVPAPTVTWSFAKDKRADKYTTIFNNNRTLVTNQSLLISPVTTSDQGYYQCEASNGVGNTLNAVIALQVHSPPEVELNQDYTAVRRGSSSGTILRCSVRGDPPLNIQWRKDSAPLDPASASSKITTSQLSSELSVTHASSADEGLYECYAANVYGDDRDSVFVQVQDVPQPPQEIRITSAGSRRVQLEWSAPTSDGGNPIQEYLIHYKSNNGDTKQERVGAGQLFGILVNLQPATVYQVHVTASNALGQSQPSSGSTFITDEEAPQGHPLDVSGSILHSRGFTLNWAPPSQRLQNGLILSYLVTIESPNRTINRTIIPSSSSGGSLFQHQLTGLRPNTNHVVYIQAVNSQGSGPPSPSLTIRTAEDVPEEEPLNVACVALSSQSLQITWQPPRLEARNGIIRGYRVSYEPVDVSVDGLQLIQLLDSSGDQQMASAGMQLTTSELTIFLSNLRKYSNYSIQVSAFTAVGDGVLSKPLICTTEEDIPDMPSKIKVIQSGPDSLIVLWLPHPRPSGQIKHFVIYSKEIDKGQDMNLQKWTVLNGNPSGGRLEVRNLRPRRSTFYFQVAAVSAQAGEGPRSPTASFTFNPINKIAAAVLSIGADYVIPRSSRVILPCSALGDGQLQLLWYLDGRPLNSDWINIRSASIDQGSILVPISSSSIEDPSSSPFTHLTNGSLLIHRLSDGGNYTCAVKNRHGQDSATYFLTILIPPPAPQLRFAASNWSSITLQWSPTNLNSSRTSRVSPIRNFVLKYRLRADGTWTELHLAAGMRTTVVQDLHCGSEYEFLLLAESRVGNSSPSNSVSARTKGSPPEYSAEVEELPPDLAEEALTPSSYTVDLKRWQDRGGFCPIQQFLIRFRPVDQDDWIIAGAENPPQSSFLLGGLQPGLNYIVRVTATNPAGSSVKDYSIRTPPIAESRNPGTFQQQDYPLSHLFSDPRVAVPIGISCLAILLTLVTLVLRYRYRSESSQNPTIPEDRPQINEEHNHQHHQGAGTLCRNNKMVDLYEDHNGVSPYAVFMPKFSTSSSSRMLKTFVSEPADKEVEMSNYQAEEEDEPTYDYIAPCRSTSSRKMMNNQQHHPSSVFVPIIPARNHHQSRGQHHHYPSDWNNQTTLAVSQRL